MYEEGYYYGRCIIACSVGQKYEGATVKCVGTSGTNEQTAVITNGKCSFTVPGRDEYTITLLTTPEGETNPVVRYSTSKICNYGEYHKVELGVSDSTTSGLQAAIDTGRPEDYFSVGDQSSFEENGESALFDILHINYQKETFGANVILGRHNALATSKRMHNTTTTGTAGFSGMELSSWLNNDYYDGLDANLKAAIKNFTYYGSKGNKVNQTVTITQKIWLPLEWNVFGEIRNSMSCEHSGEISPVQFDAFRSNAHGERIKTFGSSNKTCSWWLSSPYNNSTSGYCAISQTGISEHIGVTSHTGCTPCFMVGGTS